MSATPEGHVSAERTIPRLGVVFDRIGVRPGMAGELPVMVLDLSTEDRSVGSLYSLDLPGALWFRDRILEVIAVLEQSAASQNGHGKLWRPS